MMTEVDVRFENIQEVDDIKRLQTLLIDVLGVCREMEVFESGKHLRFTFQ